jgi:hypothetical protein
MIPVALPFVVLNVLIVFDVTIDVGDDGGAVADGPFHLDAGQDSADEGS